MLPILNACILNLMAFCRAAEEEERPPGRLLVRMRRCVLSAAALAPSCYMALAYHPTC